MPSWYSDKYSKQWSIDANDNILDPFSHKPDQDANPSLLKTGSPLFGGIDSEISSTQSPISLGVNSTAFKFSSKMGDDKLTSGWKGHFVCDYSENFAAAALVGAEISVQYMGRLEYEGGEW